MKKTIQLESNEYIIKEVREHMFFVILDMISFLVIGIGPVIMGIILLFAPLIIPGIFPITQVVWSAWPLITVWLLIIWAQYFTSFTFYYLRYLVITNERIIEVEQKNFFNREVSSFRLENIQDIIVQSSGILASILNYGDVYIQTASKQNDFNIKNAPKPEEIKQIINDHHANYMESYKTGEYKKKD